MNPDDQIKAIAELDGLHEFTLSTTKFTALMEACCDICGKSPSFYPHKLPNYLHSYDAIIPVIQKQNLLIMTEVGIQLQILWKKSGKGIPTSNNTEGWIAWTLITTPSQLCEALLRATGKWTTQ